MALITPSVKGIRKFQQIFLALGETPELIFTITWADLAFVGKDFKIITKKGEFDILIGKEKKGIFYKKL